VPAAAVKLVGQALFVVIGRKGCVGGCFLILLNFGVATLERAILLE
jgi:hypothetical protein